MTKLKGRKKILEKKLAFLKTMQSLPIDKQNILLPYLTFDGCSCIYDCVLNVISNKSIPPNEKNALKKKLAKHKSAIRYMINPKKNAKNKKVKLVKVGGGFLMPILATALPMLINYIFNKKKK
jgi:hypothetical protein